MKDVLEKKYEAPAESDSETSSLSGSSFMVERNYTWRRKPIHYCSSL